MILTDAGIDWRMANTAGRVQGQSVLQEYKLTKERLDRAGADAPSRVREPRSDVTPRDQPASRTWAVGRPPFPGEV